MENIKVDQCTFGDVVTNGWTPPENPYHYLMILRASKAKLTCASIHDGKTLIFEGGDVLERFTKVGRVDLSECKQKIGAIDKTD